jgi:hypothetical protein
MMHKIKSLQMIHLAICIGMLVAYIFVGEITMDTFKVPTIDSSALIYLLIPVLAVFLSNFLFNSQLKQIDKKANVEDMLPIYQTASIIRWAVLEGGAFIILFAQPNLIVFGILLIVYLIILRPTQEKMERDLDVKF